MEAMKRRNGGQEQERGEWEKGGGKERMGGGNSVGFQLVICNNRSQ